MLHSSAPQNNGVQLAESLRRPRKFNARRSAPRQRGTKPVFANDAAWDQCLVEGLKLSLAKRFGGVVKLLRTFFDNCTRH